MRTTALPLRFVYYRFSALRVGQSAFDQNTCTLSIAPELEEKSKSLYEAINGHIAAVGNFKLLEEPS
jgi:hypothetical protein